jgi:GTP pyrophosphokinase
VSAANIKTLPNQTAEILVTIDVEDTKHLAYVMNRISNFGDVISILRLFGKATK